MPSQTLRTTPRRLALQSVLTLAIVATLSACASHAPTPQNLATTVAQTPALSTFNTLVIQAGLTETLKATGPFTVFAPSDAAFKAVPAKTMAELQADKALLKTVLSFHMVDQRIAAADVKPGNAKTLQGSNVALATAGTFVTVEDAIVEKADIQATNGVVHVVDRVLMPPKK